MDENTWTKTQESFCLFVFFLWSIILFDFRWYKYYTALFGKTFFVHSVESGTSEKVLQ